MRLCACVGWIWICALCACSKKRDNFSGRIQYNKTYKLTSQHYAETKTRVQLQAEIYKNNWDSLLLWTCRPRQVNNCLRPYVKCPESDPAHSFCLYSMDVVSWYQSLIPNDSVCKPTKSTLIVLFWIHKLTYAFGAALSENVPSNIWKMRRFRLSCACAKNHTGLCSLSIVCSIQWFC